MKGVGRRRAGALIGLVIVALLAVGCVPVPAAVSSAAQGPIVSFTVAVATPPAGGEPAALNSAPAGTLEARRVSVEPRLDGQMDAVWAATQPVRIPLTWGLHGAGPQSAFELELRSVRTADTLYFLARWPGDLPTGAPDSTFNKLTIHWTIPAQAGQPAPACAVACHTAYANSRGQVAYVNSETIPQGGQDALAGGGGWGHGEWSVAWSRPLVSTNAYDLQFSDLTETYLFFVKVFEGVDGRPDPVSKPYALEFVGAR